MPVMQLTKKNVDSVPFFKKKGHQILYHDRDLKGFGLRVGSDTKTYFVQRAVNGRPVRTTIGKHGLFSPDQARNRARELLVNMINGTNPNKVKKENKSEIITFQQAFDKRIEAKGSKLSETTVAGYKSIMSRYLSDWKNKSLTDITKSMIMDRYAHITKEHGPYVATQAMRMFSVTYNYARYLNTELGENPVVVLSLTKSWHRATRRQTVVKSYNLPAWYSAVMSEQNETVRDYLIMLLFTGLRRSEAAQLKWEDVDFNEKTFTVHETKNGHSHVLPFGQHLEGMLYNRSANRINEYVFPGVGFPGHIKDPKKAVKRVTELTGIKFSAHDLRRTFITTAESLDLSPYTIKYLINHRTNNDLTGGYMVLDVNRMREPMKRIEAKLLELVKYDKKISNT